jgi:hypothetical protein
MNRTLPPQERQRCRYQIRRGERQTEASRMPVGCQSDARGTRPEDRHGDPLVNVKCAVYAGLGGTCGAGGT